MTTRGLTVAQAGSLTVDRGDGQWRFHGVATGPRSGMNPDS